MVMTIKYIGQFNPLDHFEGKNVQESQKGRVIFLAIGVHS